LVGDDMWSTGDVAVGVITRRDIKVRVDLG